MDKHPADQGHHIRERREMAECVHWFVNGAESNQWLYAGIFTAHGCKRPEGQKNFFYDLQARASCSEFCGRLIVEYERTCRQSYLYGENVMDQMTIAAIRPVRLTIGEFPGFKAIDLAKVELDLIVRQSLESWRTALSNDAGV